LSLELIGWHDEYDLDDRRRLRNAMLFSLALHGSIFAAFAVTPARSVAPMPQVLAIELVAAPPTAARASRPKPAPPPAQTPAPAPPVVKAPVQVLPEETPGRILKAKPKVVAKAKPKPEPAIRRPRKEKALSYEEAMADALADEDETADLLKALRAPAAADSSGQPEASDASETKRTGAVVSPELLAWNRATQRRIQSKWVTPPSFRGRGLATSLELQLSASGVVIGTPKVVGTSGDPFFDDNAVRAVMTVAPLPPPPKAGRRIFLFRSEAN
jgi:colicin import membrane protein